MLKLGICTMRAKHMKCSFKCIIQVYELAPPTCVLKNFNWSLSFVISLPLCQILPYHSYLCFSPPLSTISTKGELKLWIGWGETMWNKDHFLNFGSISHLQIRVILYHAELNTYCSFSRSNTRFTSPQTCHMLPLDHFKHTSNSGTIQASNLFDFHE